MSASQHFAKRFRVKNLRAVYVEKIRESRAVGIDRMRPPNLNKILGKELGAIADKVADGTYSFTAYKQKLISKGANQVPRVLSIPTARDRITLRALCQALQDVFPDSTPEIPQSKIEALKTNLAKGVFKEYVRLDLRNFYGSIDHAELEKAVKKRIRKKAFVALIKKAVETPTVPDGSPSAGLPQNKIGVPQGLSISNQLAEITIKQIDDLFVSRVDIAYFRYVDDILILTAAGQGKQVAKDAIEQLKLRKFVPHDPAELNSKSRIGVLTEPFSFLGYQVSNDRLSVRRESILRLEAALAAIMTNYRYRISLAKNLEQRNSAIRLCEWRINLKITGCIFEDARRGWVFYFSQINDTSCLRALQNTIDALLKRFGATGVIKPKSFVKAFYESSRKDKAAHKYIPNFDTMSIDGMRDILSIFLGAKKVFGLSDKRVEQLFRMRVRHAVKELEADLAGLS